MIFMTTEDKAAKIFKKYDNVAAFTLGKSKGITINDMEIGYETLKFLPDEDTINAVIAGDMKAKKVIKKAIKALHNPSESDEAKAIALGMTMTVNIIDPEKAHVKKKKKGSYLSPNIIVLVIDEKSDMTAQEIARIKFLKKYLIALFNEFGVRIIEGKSANKVIKKLFCGKKKKDKKRSKIREKVAIFKQENKAVRVSDEGHLLKRFLMNYYAVELRQTSLNALDINEMPAKKIASLVGTLKDVYTNDSIAICDLWEKKKDQEHVAKTLKKKNIKCVKAYNTLRDALKEAGIAKLPKVKNGYVKGKDKYKMDAKKFVKFFLKNKNRNLLALVYIHTTYILMGVEMGDTEYTKRIKKAFGPELADALKSYAKKESAPAAKA